MKRIRRTYLILPTPSYDPAQRAWTAVPYLIDRLEQRTDPVGLYLRRKMGASVALVNPSLYPDLYRREQL